MWAEYSLLILIPVFIALVSIPIFGRGESPLSLRRLVSMLIFTLVCLGLLLFFILTNPYGKEINSYMDAIAMTPVVIALLALIIIELPRILELFQVQKLLFGALICLILALIGVLIAIEPPTFLVLGVLTLLIVVGWRIGTRAATLPLTVLVLLCTAVLLLTAGGAFFLPGFESLDWQLTTLSIAEQIAWVSAVIFSAAILYSLLREVRTTDRKQGFLRLVLLVLLLIGITYRAYWEGIWSSAHARAFEDHLPIALFLVSLAIGIILTLLLRGFSRLAGPGFVLLLTSLAVLAFSWGWKVSAFKITQARAERVRLSIEQFYRKQSRYPTSLAELTPGYLFYLPPPVVVRYGGWCYHAGADDYSLSYISGKFTYFEQEFFIQNHAQAGILRQAFPACEEWIEKLESGKLTY